MKARKWLIALMAVTVSGCSMRRLAIENFEWLATRAAANFADLTGPQKDQFQNDLRSFSQRIRDKQLLPFIKLLDALPEARDTTAAAALITELNDGFRLAASEACGAFASLMAGLSPAQMDYFQRKLSERNEKYDPRRNGGLAASRLERKNEAKSNAEDWFGTLNNDQIAFLDQPPATDFGASDSLEDEYLAYRVESQRVFVDILRARRGHPVELERDCRTFVERPDDLLSARGRKSRDLQRELRSKTGGALLASLDPSQRAHFRREIDRLIRDLNAWSAHIGNP